MGALRCIWVAVATALLLAAGCDVGGNLEIPNEPTGGSGAGNPAGTGAGGATTGSTTGATGGGPGVSPVLVGITPTAAAEAGEPTAADELEARLAVLGMGARAAVLTVPWDGDPETEGATLSKQTQFAAEHGQAVALSLLVVDRAKDLRPAAVADLEWDAPESIAAVKETIDRLYEASGAETRFLVFGRDVDVYLAAHPDDRASFLAFAKEACAHARSHADAPEMLGVGVGLSSDAPETEPTFQDLIELQDAVAFSYFPGLGTYEPEASSGVAASLTQMADAVGGKPIVLLGAGYASDATAGGSEDAQQQFYKTLFGAVAARRESFALVNAVELNDARPGACAAWAEGQGEPPDGPLAAYACSLGLIGADGAPRPAWGAVLAGSAALGAP